MHSDTRRTYRQQILLFSWQGATLKKHWFYTITVRQYRGVCARMRTFGVTRELARYVQTKT